MPSLSEPTLRFIAAHRTDDVRRLALQAARYPEVDMPLAITQIAGRQIATVKVPTWAQTEGVLYPAHLSLEQCSGEVTARYKADVIKSSAPLHRFADLTGGFGIDCSFLSACFREAIYIERQEALCDIARHNFPLLGLSHIRVVHGDGTGLLHGLEPVDWLFLDPARRDGHGGKVVAIADCEPDVCALETELLAKAAHVMVKLSPMLDVSLALRDLKHVHAVHVVSVDNECKELLLILNREVELPEDEVPMTCVNLPGSPQGLGGHTSFVFTRVEEQAASCPYTGVLGRFLYEPNASLLKAGAFRTIAARYGLRKLHRSSHLYTSNELLPDFPGRSFEVEGSCGFGKKDLKQLKSYLGDKMKANLTIRNFPASVAELRKKLKLSEGGDRYLFATTLTDENRVLVWCKRL